MAYGNGPGMGGQLSVGSTGSSGGADTCRCSVPARVAPTPPAAPPGGPAAPLPATGGLGIVFVACLDGAGYAVSGLLVTCAETNQSLVSTCASGDQMPFATFSNSAAEQPYTFSTPGGGGFACGYSGYQYYPAVQVARNGFNPNWMYVEEIPT